jgi:antitoxin component of MazEF toxin-antitoxin module
LVRQDTPAGIASADGDIISRRATNFGAAYSQIVDSSGNFVDSFGGGVQYTEGDTDTTITGTAIMWEAVEGSSTLETVNATNPLPVDANQAGTWSVQQNGTWRIRLQDESATSLTATTVGSDHALDINLVQSVDLGVFGDVAHDAADSGDPVKIGGVAEDYDTFSADTEKGAAEVADGDRVQLSLDQAGRVVERPNSVYYSLADLNQTYDGTPSEDVSQNIDCEKYRFATLGYELTESGAATDIRLEVEVSLDGTNYVKLTNNALSSLIYDDGTIATAGTLDEAYSFELHAQKVRVRVITNGTGASDTFTVANALLYLSN